MLCFCSMGLPSLLIRQSRSRTSLLKIASYTPPSYLVTALFLGSTACCYPDASVASEHNFDFPFALDIGLSWTRPFLLSAARLSTPESGQPANPILPSPLFEPSKSHISWNLCFLFLFAAYFIGSWVWLNQPIPLSLYFCLDASWRFCFQNPKTLSLMMLFCLPAISRKSEPNSHCIQQTVGKASTLCNRKNKCEVCIFSSDFASSILPVKYLSSQC